MTVGPLRGRTCMGLPGGPRRPAGFTRRELRLPAGTWCAVIEDEWRDTLVLLRRGEVELHCLRGGQRRFGPGAVLWFDGMGLLALHNPGTVEALLVGIARRSGTTTS